MKEKIRIRKRNLKLLAAVFIGVSAAAAGAATLFLGRKDRADHNIEIIRQFWADIWNGKKTDRIPKFVSSEFVFHSAGRDVRSLDEFVIWVSNFQQNIKDIRLMTDDIFVCQDKVVTRWRIKGLHNGAFDLPATGQPIELSGITIFRMKSGKIVEGWVEQNAFENYRELKMYEDQPLQRDQEPRLP